MIKLKGSKSYYAVGNSEYEQGKYRFCFLYITKMQYEMV